MNTNESNKLRHYLVTWEIDKWAESAKEAAHDALRIMRDKNSIATVFTVRDVNAHDSANAQIFDITEAEILDDIQGTTEDKRKELV